MDLNSHFLWLMSEGPGEKEDIFQYLMVGYKGHEQRIKNTRTLVSSFT